MAILNITIHVDEHTTAQLNSGTDAIDDILVLHLEGGKDFFVSFYYICLFVFLFLDWILVFLCVWTSI